jgi:hypothetical protein
MDRLHPADIWASERRSDIYKGRHKDVLNQLPESVYSEPLAHTRVQKYDSRMEWIQKRQENTIV